MYMWIQQIKKFIPFYPGILELSVVWCKASGKNIDSDDGYRVVLWMICF